MKKLLLIAGLLYLLIAPFLYHPDNKLVLFWAGQDNGNVWNIWEYGEKYLAPTNQFNYPPLHFYLDKIQYAIAKPMAGAGFDAWLASPNFDDPFHPKLARYSLAIKMTLIGFALLVGYLLYLLAREYNAKPWQAQLVASIWLFNPVVIYSIPIMGQNDVMAIAGFLIGWLALLKAHSTHKRARWWLIASGITFGLSASIKMYPLLWLPLLLLTMKVLSVKQRIIVMFLSLATYGVTLLPFITNKSFQINALQNSLSDRFLYSQVGMGFDEAVNIVVIIIVIFVFGILYRHTYHQNQLGLSTYVLMVFNLILLGFNHFHPQWMTWVVPFFSLWIITLSSVQLRSSLFLSTLIVGSWILIIVLFADASLSFGMFVPSNPAMANMPMLRDILLMRDGKPFILNNMAHSIIAGVSIVGVIYLFINSTFSRHESFLSESILASMPSRSKKVFTGLMLVVILSLPVFIVTMANILPIASSSRTPTVLTYRPLLGPLQHTFIAERDKLNRLDLYVNNRDLENSDEFLLSVSDAQGNVVLVQQFSGRNTGLNSSIRFDIPPQLGSAGNEYLVSLTPLTADTQPLDVASTTVHDNPTLAIKTFYKNDTSLKAIHNRISENSLRIWEAFTVE